MAQPSRHQRPDDDREGGQGRRVVEVKEKLSATITSLLSAHGTGLLFGVQTSPKLSPQLLAKELSSVFKISVSDEDVIAARSVYALERLITSKLQQPGDKILSQGRLPSASTPKPAVKFDGEVAESIEQIKIGTKVGPYLVTRFLGRGGFARVYGATHESTEKKVAIKVGQDSGGGRQVTRLLEVTNRVCSEGISPDELPAEMVFRESGGIRIDTVNAAENDELIRVEAQKLRSIEAPGWVSLLDEFELGGRPVLVLDYARGQNLRQKIRSLNGIYLNWFLAVTRSLEQSGPHGDLKPENMIVSPSGKVTLIDPGVSLNGRGFTQTPHYNPFLLTDARADVYSIGIMIYEILTGSLPFDEVPWEFAGKESGGDEQRLSQSYFLSIPTPSALNPKTPPDLERIVLNCLNFRDYGLSDLRQEIEAFIAKA